jgi:hypothetical protein
VIGVSGNLPVQGVGTANFGVFDEDGELRIWKIHNCLLCHKNNGEEEFNLISVSQILRTRRNTVSFGCDQSKITIKSLDHKSEYVFPLQLDDGLYSVAAFPVSQNDRRMRHSVCLDITLEVDSVLSTDLSAAKITTGPAMKSPSRLVVWFVKVLWIGTVRMLSGISAGFGDELISFCQEYIAPLPIPENKKRYQVDNIEDMSDLSIRFFGIGTERLAKTLERSIGLSLMVKVDGKMRNKVPTHNFPQGAWKRSKTPRVSKGIVRDLHRAAIGEVLFTDTFEVDDSCFRYGQAYVDYRSKYGEIIPLKSRSQVGWSFAEFCSQHFTPLILIRDNIGENVGGDLVQECLKRTVKSAFFCPFRKQQNYVEGYLGRVCSLATYGMVYAGAPMFMWRWCIICAVFVNNITATYFSEEDVWATPSEVVHNEPFSDSSIVVPFGCGVLVLLTEEEQGKFKSKCALMVFVHYANKHPLYTYAVYSPLTKRIIYRQDCIFLTNLFPMRTARTRDGLNVEGDSIIPYRSPRSIRDSGEDVTSFRNWNTNQPIPAFHDHVTGQLMTRPPVPKMTPVREREVTKYVYPNNPHFGPPSVVKVPVEFKEEIGVAKFVARSEVDEGNIHELEGVRKARPKRSKKIISSNETTTLLHPSTKRKPVKERWCYEPVPAPEETPLAEKCETALAIISSSTSIPDGNEVGLNESLHIPTHVGTLEVLPESFLSDITIDEAGGCSLQGVIFYDDELEWCRISGWGTENGIPIVFYSSILLTEPAQEENFASLTDMIGQIKQSPHPLVVPKCEPSRILQLSHQKTLCYRQSGCQTKLELSPLGSYNVRQFGAKVGSYNGKLLSDRILRRILKAQETIFKYGTLIPRNDAEANRSPEAKRWLSGKQLEWIRLQQASTFEHQWTWVKVQQACPNYKKSDIGHLFFIYDYKFSGEHRVRLVFDGSRQSEATYNNTYAPTVRPESVRLFHVYAVEYSWLIRQYDVPQAFLRSKADCDIFVYPPNGFPSFQDNCSNCLRCCMAASRLHIFGITFSMTFCWRLVLLHPTWTRVFIDD